MMYVIYNNDGSIKAKNLNEVVIQGSNGVNELFVAIIGRSASTYSLCAIFKLPNDTTRTVLSSDAVTETIEGTEYTGIKIALTDAETMLDGVLQMNVIALDQNDVKLVAFSTYITINESGITLSDPVLITLQEYLNLINNIYTK